MTTEQAIRQADLLIDYMRDERTDHDDSDAGQQLGWLIDEFAS